MINYKEFKSVVNYVHNENVANDLNENEMKQEFAIWKQEQLKILNTPDVSKSLPIGDVEILLISLEHIGKWGDEEEERWDDPGDCAMDAIVQYRYSIK